MAFAKLQIVVEKEGGKLQFDESNVITALFNPKQLAYGRSVGWKSASAAQRDVPELQFTTAEPGTLSVDLLFDTYDTPKKEKDDVRKVYTDKMLHLSTVETHGDKHRPPVCRLRWGAPGYFFQGVLEKQDQKFTLFVEDGTPVRATVSCSFKEWRTNYEDLNRQAKGSADVAKQWLVKRGDSLSRIAAQEYMDPALWRPIAEKNHLDDPLDLSPGRLLRIPTLSLEEQTRKGGSRP
jgi:nucleoid-associated protein YgaU